MEKKKTSNSFWKTEILKKLRLDDRKKGYKLAIVGLGSELYGDDFSGLFVAQKLKREIPSSSNLIVLEGGTLPENFTGVLRRFRPNDVLLVDAADFNTPAGTIQILDIQQITGFSASSHGMPLTLLSSFLEKEFNCTVTLLGIQPKTITFGEEQSRECKEACEEVIKYLCNCLIESN